MSQNEEIASKLELNARVVLHDSLTRIDARTRSRLNQARQRALAEVQKPRWTLRHGLKLMPITGAVAAALVAALLFFNHAPRPLLAPTESGQPLEVLDLLADDDGLSLMEDYDHSFYEWAAAEGDSASEAPPEASG
ncbi:MAG TPA: hypothetical protein VMG11_15710 [Steroidobacteraceae bacterium]|nr:hypothetical protein [Steroidobacteraceae bacterium]